MTRLPQPSVRPSADQRRAGLIMLNSGVDMMLPVAISHADAPSRDDVAWAEPIYRTTPGRRTWIYVASVGPLTIDALVKIGVTNNVTARLKALQTHHPAEVRLVAAVWEYPWLEREIHKQYAPLRERGEWFTVDLDLLTFCVGLHEATNWWDALGIDAELEVAA